MVSEIAHVHTGLNGGYIKSNRNFAVTSVTAWGKKRKAPEITLDTTLEQLYAQDCLVESTPRTAMLVALVGSEIPLSRNVAPNTKYLYQDRPSIKAPIYQSEQHRHEMQVENAIKYLALVPQRDAFAAGNMPVILFNLDGPEGPTAHSKNEVEKTMISLRVDQRPQMLFFDGPEQMSLRENGIDEVAPKMHLDQLEGHPLTVNPDTTYFINTKAALCESGLPSPKAVLLELEGHGGSPEDCCPTCKSAKEGLTIRPDCTGARGKWLKTQISRTISRVASQQLPFVLKFQQSHGGGGTFVITSPKERSDLEHDLATLILSKLYSRVNPTNAYLKPATIILSEMIQNPVGNWALTFFVTRTGRTIFLAVTEQTVDSSNSWIGSTVNYLAQEKLKQKFTPLMENIGSWLHSHGYFGPCGADILETDESDDTPGALSRFKIVDLNVRVPGSFLLTLLKGHFSDRRQLHEASAFSMSARMSRESFIALFEDSILQGRMIIASWYEDPDSGVSFGSLLVGARDLPALEKAVAAVKSIASDVHF